jgi:hypothetical protein
MYDRGKLFQPPRQTATDTSVAAGGQQEKPRAKRANDVGNDLTAREKRTRAAATGAEEVQVDVVATATDPGNNRDESYAPSGDNSGASTECDSSPCSSPDRQASARQQHEEQALTGANTGIMADVSKKAPQQFESGLHTVPPPQVETSSAAKFKRMLGDLLEQGAPGSPKRDEIWLTRVRGCIFMVCAPPPCAMNAPTSATTPLPILCSAYPVASCYTHQ